MGLNEQGRRLEKFFPGIPCDIDAGAFLDQPCAGGFMRHGWTAEGSHGVLCCELVDRLIPCLMALDSQIKQWDRAHLLTQPEPRFIPHPPTRRTTIHEHGEQVPISSGWTAVGFHVFAALFVAKLLWNLAVPYFLLRRGGGASSGISFAPAVEVFLMLGAAAMAYLGGSARYQLRFLEILLGGLAMVLVSYGLLFVVAVVLRSVRR